jgi:hypothetical protein
VALTSTVSAIVRGPHGAVFEWFIPVELSVILLGYGTLPTMVRLDHRPTRGLGPTRLTPARSAALFRRLFKTLMIFIL